MIRHDPCSIGECAIHSFHVVNPEVATLLVVFSAMHSLYQNCYILHEQLHVYQHHLGFQSLIFYHCFILSKITNVYLDECGWAQ